MEKKVKHCPLLMAAFIRIGMSHIPINENNPTECLKEDCGWWSDPLIRIGELGSPVVLRAGCCGVTKG